MLSTEEILHLYADRTRKPKLSSIMVYGIP